jgi:GNAT superfamily N-acetyltransferase
MNATPPEPPTGIIPVCMARPNLLDIPEFAAPAGWSLRGYRPGDAAHWQRIHLVAEREHEITPALFREQFGQDEELLASRQCYLQDPQGQAIGTATAWFDDHFQGGRWGRVHWVAIVPEYQGRGLAKPLMTAVCQRLRELGHDRAFLRTTASRVSAINLYLRFGFGPLPRDVEEARVWQTLAARLKYSLLPM